MPRTLPTGLFCLCFLGSSARLLPVILSGVLSEARVARRAGLSLFDRERVLPCRDLLDCSCVIANVRERIEVTRRNSIAR